MCMTSEPSEGRNGNFLDKDPGPGGNTKVVRTIHWCCDQGSVRQPGVRRNVSVIVGELWIMMDQTLTYNTTPRIHK